MVSQSGLLQRCILAVGLLVAGCDASGPDHAVGTIERHRLNLVADTNEPIAAIHVVEGQEVTAGTVVAVQETRRLEQQLDGARSDADVALGRMQEAESGPRAEQIAAARARLAAAESAYKTIRIELQRAEALLAEQFTSQNSVDLLQGRHDEARAQRDEANVQLDELLRGTRSEQLDQVRAAYAAAKSKVAGLEIDLDRAWLRAPVDAVVESIVFRAGERPQPGQTVVALLATDRLIARVHVPEPLRTRISPGSAARIRVDGHDQEYDGVVRWISSEASFTPYYALTQADRSRLAYLAEIDLPDGVDLPNGIPVEVRFSVTGHE